MPEIGNSDYPSTSALDSESLQQHQTSPGSSSPQGNLLNATFRALRHRNYRLYFFGQLVSLTGTWMQTTALTWLAFEITLQSKWVSLVTVAQILPTFLLG